MEPFFLTEIHRKTPLFAALNESSVVAHNGQYSHICAAYEQLLTVKEENVKSIIQWDLCPLLYNPTGIVYIVYRSFAVSLALSIKVLYVFKMH